MKKWILLLGVIALSGCNKTVGEMNYAEIQQLAAQIKNRCAAQGAGPGTSQWETCAKVESNYEIRTRETQRAQMRQMGDAVAEGSARASASYNAAVARPSYAAPAPVYCQTQQYGQLGTISCQ